MLTFHIIDVCIKCKIMRICSRTHTWRAYKMKASLNSEALYTASADVCLYLCVFYKVNHRLHFMQHLALRFPHVWITPPAWHTHSSAGTPSVVGLHPALFIPTYHSRQTRSVPGNISPEGDPHTHTQRELSESLPLQMQHLWLWLLTIRTLCVGVWVCVCRQN